uniref:Uncharacterized protein n=1 Tax=Utricularia reniformis TaxID=192314 RepID=A0A1Y0AZS3_9LAMI|nr:hypothetical protein AEK19_MT0356 [Utricularia reniformis]ART30628.1 hypothetical protein AEK19_MT0356 [Utricularia reniformis]
MTPQLPSVGDGRLDLFVWGEIEGGCNSVVKWLHMICNPYLEGRQLESRLEPLE